MSKLNRRDFLKQISAIPFVAIPLIKNLGIDENSNIGWDTAKLGEVNKSVSYVRVNIGESEKYFRVY